ncbi:MULTISPECIES: cell division protein ZapA [Sediminibacillus]|uniref:Cell division protein ZapA n=1 Tax=Sediminibacillus dalangtanensis TaxID=2729421 RepID=A0ABX7VWZ2_9BACI|nr:cell division protein ZapA [Sediminibacillus dalangtanensis]QTN00019.1 cell division protein ZapA [Sediminibacillus dalangtanensis]
MSQSDKTRTTVEIHNRSYTIVGDEPAHHVRMVASLVDQQMREIQETNRSLDTTRLAVLTAVNTMNDYLKLKEEYTELLGSIKQKKEQDNND